MHYEFELKILLNVSVCDERDNNHYNVSCGSC